MATRRSRRPSRPAPRAGPAPASPSGQLSLFDRPGRGPQPTSLSPAAPPPADPRASTPGGPAGPDHVEVEFILGESEHAPRLYLKLPLDPEKKPDQPPAGSVDRAGRGHP